jgi:hypothetical protein
MGRRIGIAGVKAGLKAGLAAGLLTLGGATAWACADSSCYPSWKLASSGLDCAGRGMLSPGNDTRVNLMLMMADRAGRGPVSRPKPDYDSYHFGSTFVGWALLRESYFPSPARGENDYLIEPRCQRVEAGGKAFAAAMTAAGLGADERSLLTEARQLIDPGCAGSVNGMPGAADAAAPTPPDLSAIASAKGRAYLAYLKAAEHFYAGRWDAARTGFSALTGNGDGWLADTASYMLARVELGAAVAPAFGEFGWFDQSKVDQTANARAGRAISAYFKAHPKGAYAGSARGLIRRVQWLAGDQSGLAGEYARLVQASDLTSANAAALVEEVDNKLLMQRLDAATVRDPMLLATLLLSRLREGGSYTEQKLELGELQSLRAAFASQPELYTFLEANHAYYIAKDMKRVLALLPDDARKPGYSTLAFSRQMLRGMALAALGDRNEAGFWRELLGGANAPWQHSLVELGLALNMEKRGEHAAIFAPGSAIRDPMIRQTLLYFSAGPQVLRAVARDAGQPQRDRDTALFTLLRKQLQHGQFDGFVRDAALIPAAAKADGSYGHPSVEGPIALGQYTRGKTSDGYDCPALIETARTLAARPRDAKARLCLGDFWRLNSFDNCRNRAGPRPVLSRNHCRSAHAGAGKGLCAVPCDPLLCSERQQRLRR